MDASHQEAFKILKQTYDLMLCNRGLPLNMRSLLPPLQSFPAFQSFNQLAHAFVLRWPGVAMDTDRATALQRLQGPHRQVVAHLGFAMERFFTVNQVHGDAVCQVDERLMPEEHGDGHDALVTNVPGVLLGIYVADCCAIYLHDPVSGACGLAHAGKKGTELEIAAKTLQKMQRCYGTRPENVIIQLSPCIRPPCYEIDFAAEIRRQCAAAGVPAQQIHDCGENTALDAERYYSYRRELGKTGRMLALLGRRW